MVRGMRSGSRDTTDLLRGAGGVLLAAGCVALFARKAGGQHPWSGFALLLLVLIPAVVLYTLALTGANRGLGGGGESWRSVLMVVAILLGPVVLAQTLEVLGADTNTALYDAAIFALTALIAAYGASRARVPYAVLLAALSLLVAWLIVWGQILNHPSADTFRILLIAGAALLFVAATALERAKGDRLERGCHRRGRGGCSCGRGWGVCGHNRGHNAALHRHPHQCAHERAAFIRLPSSEWFAELRLGSLPPRALVGAHTGRLTGTLPRPRLRRGVRRVDVRLQHRPRGDAD
jgi:hypothetical protein